MSVVSILSSKIAAVCPRSHNDSHGKLGHLVANGKEGGQE
jgi:hypothetical protein